MQWKKLSFSLCSCVTSESDVQKVTQVESDTICMIHVQHLLKCNFQISVFVWPVLQTINFRFVPAQFRPIYVGVFSFFWTTGLAGLKYNDQMPNVFKTVTTWAPGPFSTKHISDHERLWLDYHAKVSSSGLEIYIIKSQLVEYVFACGVCHCSVQAWALGTGLFFKMETQGNLARRSFPVTKQASKIHSHNEGGATTARGYYIFHLTNNV